VHKQAAEDVRQLIAQDTSLSDVEREVLHSSMYQLFNHVLARLRARVASQARTGLASVLPSPPHGSSSSATTDEVDDVFNSSLEQGGIEDATAATLPATLPSPPRSPRLAARQRLTSTSDDPLVMEADEYEAQSLAGGHGGPDELGDVAVSMLTNAHLGSRTSVSDDGEGWSDLSAPVFGMVQVRLLSYK
jgi:hypothetical protein